MVFQEYQWQSSDFFLLSHVSVKKPKSFHYYCLLMCTFFGLDIATWPNRIMLLFKYVYYIFYWNIFLHAWSNPIKSKFALSATINKFAMCYKI